MNEFCEGSKVYNLAISGATAWQWRKGGVYSVIDAFQTAGSDITHVWLSVGGNDFMSPGNLHAYWAAVFA